MTDHEHIFDQPPSPSAMEDGDERRSCACGQRQVVRRFTFPYVPPGDNQLHRLHHYAIANLRARIHDDMGKLVRRESLIERGRLTLDFRWRTRHKRDPLNFATGAKAIVDALIGVWIIDDDATHLEAVVRGQVGTGEPDRVIVTLEERT